MNGQPLFQLTDRGLYCAAGDFFVDPWRPVERAVVTHGHGDHARMGSSRYLSVHSGRQILRSRLGPDAVIDTVDYGETVSLNGVSVSLHPAGHILGSAQVRVEHRGEVWVISGDYKIDPDSTCEAFEPVRCHTFVTESTFGLPIYRWPRQEDEFAQINAWWRENQRDGRASLLFGYALGKAQRIIAGVDPTIGPICTHGAVELLNEDYRAAGVALPPTERVTEVRGKRDWSQALIVAPPSAQGTPWIRRFGDFSAAFASGWMLVRGTRRWRAVDRGFVLSDHADWPDLLSAIEATGAERVLVTHGTTGVMARYLREKGLDAAPLKTEFESGEDESDGAPIPKPDAETTSPAAFATDTSSGPPPSTLRPQPS